MGLPQEILDLIIDTVALDPNDRHSGLLEISRASWPLRSRAITHIFRRIRVCNALRAVSLLHILEGGYTICTSVKSLSFDLTGQLFMQRRLFWRESNPVIPRLLNLLQNVDQLAILDDPGRMEWGSLSPEVDSALRNMIVSSVSSLKLRHIAAFPYFILPECIHLKELDVYATGIDLEALREPEHGVCFCALSTLRVEKSEVFLSQMLRMNALLLANLKVFQTDINGSFGVDVYSKMTSKVCQSLEELTVSYIYNAAPNGGSTIALEKFPRLKTICVTSSLEHICQLFELSNFRAFMPLQTINLKVLPMVLYPPQSLHQFFDPVFTPKWKALDDVLSGGHYPSLQNLHLWFALKEYWRMLVLSGNYDMTEKDLFNKGIDAYTNTLLPNVRCQTTVLFHVEC